MATTGELRRAAVGTVGLSEWVELLRAGGLQGDGGEAMRQKKTISASYSASEGTEPRPEAHLRDPSGRGSGRRRTRAEANALPCSGAAMHAHLGLPICRLIVSVALCVDYPPVGAQRARQDHRRLRARAQLD